MASKKQAVSSNPPKPPAADDAAAPVVGDTNIKAVIAETIKELNANDAIQVHKPKTLQGWLYIIGAITGLLGLGWTGIIKLDNMAKHAQKPHHDGVEVLVEKFQEELNKHASDRDVHRTEAELELMLLKETTPIREELNSIQQDVRGIQRSVDILVEDNRRKNH